MIFCESALGDSGILQVGSQFYEGNGTCGSFLLVNFWSIAANAVKEANQPSELNDNALVSHILFL